MSGMEMFYGTFKKSYVDLRGKDEDDIIDLEEENKCCYVDIDGQQYTATEIEEIDPCGFSLAIPASDVPRIMCLWYNGGAGVNEVVESAIRMHFQGETT